MKKRLSKMTCVDMVTNFPKGTMDDVTYQNFIQDQSSTNGQLCVVSHFSANCGPQCSQMSKNYSGCSSCLGNAQSCGNLDAQGNLVPCCPFVGPAISCANCLGLYSVDALSQCLQTGLSVPAIIGISIACIVVIILVIVLIVVVVNTRKKVELQIKLGLGNVELGNINLNKLKYDISNMKYSFNDYA